MNTERKEGFIWISSEYYIIIGTEFLMVGSFNNAQV